MSHDGVHQVAVGTSVLRSSNSGVDWAVSPYSAFNNQNNSNLWSVSLSSDGMYQLTCGYENVYESTDRGDGWSAVDVFSDTGDDVYCRSLAVNSDATVRTILSSEQLTTGGSADKIFKWDSSSATWTTAQTLTQTVSYGFLSLAMSDDGTQQLAIWRGPGGTRVVLHSVNSGAWTTLTGLPAHTWWTDAAISGDGTIQYLVSAFTQTGYDVVTGSIWESVNSGGSFTAISTFSETHGYAEVDTTSDGRHMTAFAYAHSGSATNVLAVDRQIIPDPNVGGPTQHLSGSKTFPEGSEPIKIEIARTKLAGDKSLQMILSQNAGPEIYRSTDSGLNWAPQSLPTHPTPTPAPTQQPPPPPPGPSPPPGPGSSSGDKNGAIIGGAVGGTLLIVLCGVSYLKCGPSAQHSFTNENLL